MHAIHVTGLILISSSDDLVRKKNQRERETHTHKTRRNVFLYCSIWLCTARDGHVMIDTALGAPLYIKYMSPLEYYEQDNPRSSNSRP